MKPHPARNCLRILHRKVWAGRLGLCAALAVLGAPLAVVAGPPLDRLWITWEQNLPQSCAGGADCAPLRRFTTRLLDAPDADAIHRTFGMLDRLALTRGQTPLHPEAPRFCPASMAVTDPEGWPLSDKSEALRALPGVHVSALKLKAPPGYAGRFGEDLQAEIERRFRAAGIRLLTEEERALTPGQPKLNIYFSNTNPETGCWYSVFASLSQTVLLTRNLDTKLEVGTWGASEGRKAELAGANEYDAILRVIDKFISDYRVANRPAG